MKKQFLVRLFASVAFLAGHLATVKAEGGGAEHDATPCGQDHTLYSLDTNGDDAVDLSDAVHVLHFLFRDGPPPACENAADADERHAST